MERPYPRDKFPTNSPRILQPMPSPYGMLQVKWDTDADIHRLMLGDKVELAVCVNGFSCHYLAELLIKGDPKRILKQAAFIVDRKGTVNKEEIDKILAKLSSKPTCKSCQTRPSASPRSKSR